jgi:hypothetical protein
MTGNDWIEESFSRNVGTKSNIRLEYGITLLQQYRSYQTRSNQNNNLNNMRANSNNNIFHDSQTKNKISTVEVDHS